MSLQEKLERARKNLQNSLESANELVEDSEVEDIVKIDMSNHEQTDVIQLNSQVEDFGFIRETLRENAENGRRVLRTIALDLMNSEDEMTSSLVLSFAELNKAIAENIKLYMVTYKSISETLKNIQTLESKTTKPKESMSDVKVISTSDVLEELRNAE